MTHRRFITFVQGISLIFTLSLSAAAWSAPKPDLWPAWEKSGMSKVGISHAQWDALLKKYIVEGKNGVNLFNYSAVSTADKAALKAYINNLQAAKITTFPRAEQYAFWVNLYNAATIDVVLDHYPVESITKINISPGFFARGPWDKKLFKIEGKELTLNDIEHRILRPIWNDPRTHYAVNCASIGCPNLAKSAFTASNTEELLNAGAKAFINSNRGARVENGKLIVSSIYDWFKVDFGGNDAGVIAHLKKYAAPALNAKLDGISTISDSQYNWNLNDSK